MEKALIDLNKEKIDTSEQNNDLDKDQSDLPPELNPSILNEIEDNDIDSQNKNAKSKEKTQVQNVLLLKKYVPKENFSDPFSFLDNTICMIITAIIFGIYVFSFVGISIADIVIQFINPNGINIYLIDDISLILFIICSIFRLRLENVFLSIFSIAYIADNFIFFKYFQEKNESPKYIFYFYISYFLIKVVLLIFLILIFGFIICINVCIIKCKAKRRK